MAGQHFFRFRRHRLTASPRACARARIGLCAREGTRKPQLQSVMASQERRRTNATVRGRQLGRESLSLIASRAWVPRAGNRSEAESGQSDGNAVLLS
jgi:hypothetical protein